MHFLDLIAFRVVKEGFGTWAQVMRMPADVVMDAYHYSRFQLEYADTHAELNRKTDT